MKPLKSWNNLPTMQWWRTDSATQGTITGCCLCSVWTLPEVSHLWTLHHSFYCSVWCIHHAFPHQIQEVKSRGRKCWRSLSISNISLSSTTSITPFSVSWWEPLQPLTQIFHIQTNVRRIIQKGQSSHVISEHFPPLEVCPFHYWPIF